MGEIAGQTDRFCITVCTTCSTRVTLLIFFPFLLYQHCNQEQESQVVFFNDDVCIICKYITNSAMELASERFCDPYTYNSISEAYNQFLVFLLQTPL